MSRTLIAPALIVALALAGCGDDGTKDVAKSEPGKLPPYPTDAKSAGKGAPAPAPKAAEPPKDAEKPKG